MAKAPMSKTPMPPAAADDDTMDDTTGAADQGAEGGAGDDTADEGDKVVLTVLENGDGTYTLVHGDESDGEDGGAEPEGADQGDEAEGEQAEGAEDEPKRESFESVPTLMKGILECLNQHEDGTKGSEQDNFQAGFDGDESASAKPPQKY